jgi:hypothetical protein
MAKNPNPPQGQQPDQPNQGQPNPQPQQGQSGQSNKPNQPNQPSQQGQQGQQQHQHLQSKAQQMGVDWGAVEKIVTDYGPLVGSLVLSILEKLKNRPQSAQKAQGGQQGATRQNMTCPPDLEAALKDAQNAAVDSLCACLDACETAGIEQC